MFPFADASLLSVRVTLLTLTPLWCAFFCIRGYEVTDNRELLIHRLGWKTTIKLDGLLEAWFDPGATKGDYLYMGNNGVFVYCGVYGSHMVSRYWAYLTNSKNGVVLRFSALTYIVSPDRPDEFAALVREITGAAANPHIQ